MADDDQKNAERIDALAREVMRLSQNTLLANLRFLDATLMQFRLRPTNEQTLATLGRELYYNPAYILSCYMREAARPVRDYLHLVLHCVFRHMFVDTLMDAPRWNLACDIVVEGMISEFDLNATRAARQAKQVNALEKFRAKVQPLTAEKLYRYLIDAGLSEAELSELRKLFRADDHQLWYVARKAQSPSGANGAGNEGIGGGTDSHGAPGFPAGSAQLRALWKEIAERMQQDVELFSQTRGDRAGGLMQNLRAVNRERCNYEAFLRKFAVRGEAMKVNDDEFDYIFYTYGLNLYGNVPLIEPLEYCEVKRIREFVIAIDTSGSTSGELVQAFEQKTYNIFKSTESFFNRINLHIIQCDADVQEDAKITTHEEFDAYLEHMKLRGLGGTDFRPVFAYVDELIRAKEFTNLRGMIYFTDGYGVFPERKPGYETAFVFIDDDFGNPDVPPWAIRLVLSREEIQQRDGVTKPIS